MIKEVINKLSRKENLASDEIRAVFYDIMSGAAGDEDVKTFLLSLSEKRETVDEITQAAEVIREKMTKISVPFDTLLDTCGTGGGSSSFNVSTTVALIAAAVGVKVAKHGNRSYTSHCGSADILEKLGVKVDLPPDKVAACIKEVGMGFIYAPLYHSAMKHVAGVRREIKKRTIFNLLGPLSNPAGANVQIIGVYDRSLTEVLACVLRNLGSKKAFVVHGIDGFDEVSVSDETVVSEVTGSGVNTYNIKPEDFGIRRARKTDVVCRDVDDNINTLRSILNGEKTAQRRMALINAAIALKAAGRVRSFEDGIAASSGALDSGKTKGILDALIKFTNA